MIRAVRMKLHPNSGQRRFIDETIHIHCYVYNDALLGELRRKISYKAIGAGKRMILVEPMGTSQICSVCGSEVKKDLSVREHVCPNCGLVMDRDLNASINILYRGMGKPGWTGHPVPPDMKGTNSPVMLTGAQRMGV